jgi:hypothetical protein
MRSVVLPFLLFFSICPISSGHTRKNTSRAIDPLYGSALAAANRFLHAWQAEDHETGIMMLSDSARQHVSPDRLQSFFSPGPDAAFEIARGKRVSSAAYKFPVVLFDASGTPAHRHACTVIVIHSGKDEWIVDRLP